MLELALLHLVRNRQRIALAVVSAAFAALVLTIAVLVSQGVPGTAAGTYGDFFGGDIVVLPAVPAVAEAGLQPPEGWRLQAPDRDMPDPYELLDPAWLLHPHPVRGGAAGAGQAADSAAGSGAPPADPAWLALDAELAARPEVLAVQPYLTLPAYLSFTTGKDPGQAPHGTDPSEWRLRSAPRRLRVDIRARDPVLDREIGRSPQISGGRDLAAEDEGRPVALVNAPVGPDSGNQWVLWDVDRPMYIPGMPPHAGETLHVSLPRWHGGAPDYADAASVDLTVVGWYELDNGWWRWSALHLAPGGFEPANYHTPDRPPPNERSWLTSPQIVVPVDTWRELALEAGYTGGPAAWVVRVRDTSLLNRTLATLREAYPDRLFLSVADMSHNHPFAMAPTWETPSQDIAAVHAAGAEPDLPLATPPPWVGPWVAGIAVALGVALFFANAFALYHTRQKELATLRVVGATRPQVAALVMIEVLIVVLAGAALAAVAAVPLLLFHVGTGGGGAERTLQSLAEEAALLAAMAVAFTVLMGGALAVWTARRTPWGVLKVE